MFSPDLAQQYLAWEKLCFSLLRLHREDAAIAPRQTRRLPNGKAYEADAIVTETTGQRKVVEIKLYRSSYLPSDWLAKVVERIDEACAVFGADEGILMICARLLPDQASGYRTRRMIEVLDIDMLRNIAIRVPSLLQQLDVIATERGIALDVPRDSTSVQPQFTIPLEHEPPPSARHQRIAAEAVVVAEKERDGVRLARRLAETEPGRGGFTEFEEAVKASLEHVFKGQLDKWTPQSRDDDDLRRDICAKIVGSHAFWQEMIRDFRTRFVIFECKNYAGKISQNEIHSTEKYLYRPALRNLAVMVTREGVDAGAVRAMRGALRESGKLITWLTIEDICAMLKTHDAGGEVHEILAHRLDELLLAITR
jgi:hypothetical protein